MTTTYAHEKLGGRDVYQTNYVARDAMTVAPGASASYQDQLYAGAKVVSIINTIGERYKIDRFDLMIDWGWFRFLTKPMFYLSTTCRSWSATSASPFCSPRFW